MSKPSARHAVMVALGIFLSRVSGLVRDRIFAHYFGNSLAGDAYRAALRIPNFLQNLFGEGVLSASFIPVYARLLTQDEKEAETVAGHILTWLLFLVAVLVALGVTLTPALIAVIAPGFTGEKRELAIGLVQIFFPGTGLLVLSAWCLGILNSHRKFFLSYVAPVVCNLAMMGMLLVYGSTSQQADLAVYGAWGFVLGAFLQLAVQLPTTMRLVRSLSFGWGLKLESVQTVLKNFVPVVISRGVVQVSAYVDTLLASLLPTGALSALAYAQTLYLLPISLFGMSISASQLPSMSSEHGISDTLRLQLLTGLRRIAFFVVPSTVAFWCLGDIVVGAIYQSGKFQSDATTYVWWILASYSVGLLSATLGRLYASTYYALRDTRTPLKFAVLRVSLSMAGGFWGALYAPSLLGWTPEAGAIGLTLASALSGALEFWLLKRSLQKKLGPSSLPLSFWFKLWAAAGLAAGAAFVSRALYPPHPLVGVLTVLAPYGLVYIGLTSLFRVPETAALRRRLFRSKT